MSVVDWSSVSEHTGSKGKSDDIVFLNAKNLPQTFLPGQEIEHYESVYDAEMKRPRSPKDGDTNVRSQYLFYGLFIDDKGEKTVKICSCGNMVARGIASIQETLSNLGILSFVRVTSSGSGLNTEYSVKGVKVIDKDIPDDIWEKIKKEESYKKLPSLKETKNRLLGIASSESNNDDSSDSVTKAVKNDLVI